jgi:hypothetical protein
LFVANKRLSGSDKRKSKANKRMSASNKRMFSANKRLFNPNKRKSGLNKRMSGPDKRMSEANKRLSASNKRMSAKFWQADGWGNRAGIVAVKPADVPPCGQPASDWPVEKSVKKPANQAVLFFDSPYFVKGFAK